MENKLEKSLDDLIKSSRKERTAAKKAPNDKAAQVKKRSQQLRADKVNKARGMEVDSAAKPKKVIVKPTVKGAKRPQKATAGRARPTKQAKVKPVVGKAKKGTGAKPRALPNVPPSGLIVQVSAGAGRGGGGGGGGGRRGGGRGGGRGASRGLVQPNPGAGGGRTQRVRGGGGGGARGRGGIIKPGKPQAPVGTFGSASANAAARSVARSMGGGGGSKAKSAAKPKAKAGGSRRKAKK